MGCLIWKFGEFGPTSAEMENASGGLKTFNMEIESGNFKTLGILSSDGQTVIYEHGMKDKMEKWKFVDYNVLQEMERDEFDSPPCNVNSQGEPGKLLWISGKGTIHKPRGQKMEENIIQKST